MSPAPCSHFFIIFFPIFILTAVLEFLAFIMSEWNIGLTWAAAFQCMVSIQGCRDNPTHTPLCPFMLWNTFLWMLAKLENRCEHRTGNLGYLTVLPLVILLIILGGSLTTLSQCVTFACSWSITMNVLNSPTIPLLYWEGGNQPNVKVIHLLNWKGLILSMDYQLTVVGSCKAVKQNKVQFSYILDSKELCTSA